MTTASKKHQLTNELSDHVGHGQWTKAVETLQSLIELEPANAHYHLRMGDYSLKAHNKPAAIHHYYAAADLYDKGGFSVKAIATYTMILKIVPGETLAATLMKLAEAQKERVMREEPQHSEILQRCLQSYHEVSNIKPAKGPAQVHHVT